MAIKRQTDTETTRDTRNKRSEKGTKQPVRDDGGRKPTLYSILKGWVGFMNEALGRALAALLISIVIWFTIVPPIPSPIETCAKTYHATCVMHA